MFYNFYIGSLAKYFLAASSMIGDTSRAIALKCGIAFLVVLINVHLLSQDQLLFLHLLE